MVDIESLETSRVGWRRGVDNFLHAAKLNINGLQYVSRNLVSHYEFLLTQFDSEACSNKYWLCPVSRRTNTVGECYSG